MIKNAAPTKLKSIKISDDNFVIITDKGINTGIAIKKSYATNSWRIWHNHRPMDDKFIHSIDAEKYIKSEFHNWTLGLTIGHDT